MYKITFKLKKNLKIVVYKDGKFQKDNTEP